MKRGDVTSHEERKYRPGLTKKSVVSSVGSGCRAASLMVAVHASDHSDGGSEGGFTPHCKDVAGRGYCLVGQPSRGGGKGFLGCSCGWVLEMHGIPTLNSAYGLGLQQKQERTCCKSKFCKLQIQGEEERNMPALRSDVRFSERVCSQRLPVASPGVILLAFRRRALFAREEPVVINIRFQRDDSSRALKLGSAPRHQYFGIALHEPSSWEGLVICLMCDGTTSIKPSKHVEHGVGKLTDQKTPPRMQPSPQASEPFRRSALGFRVAAHPSARCRDHPFLRSLTPQPSAA